MLSEKVYIENTFVVHGNKIGQRSKLDRAENEQTQLFLGNISSSVILHTYTHVYAHAHTHTYNKIITSVC